MPKTLLLADDSRTIQQAVNMTLAGEDVKLITASDGEAALQAAKQSKPDLILADVTMPMLGGPAPIDPAKAMAVGANGHMPKPFDSAKLIEHVKTILANPKAKPVMAPAASAPSKPPAPPARNSNPPQPLQRPAVSAPAVSPGAGSTMVMARP